MNDPLAFPFDTDPAVPDTYRDGGVAEFGRRHPFARYVVLRINNLHDLAELLADMRSWPDGDLLTPVQENPVHAEVVAVLDHWP